MSNTSTSSSSSSAYTWNGHEVKHLYVGSTQECFCGCAGKHLYQGESGFAKAFSAFVAAAAQQHESWEASGVGEFCAEVETSKGQGIVAYTA